MGRLTTHVLDTALGKPAVGMRIEVIRLASSPVVIKTITTNSDGRADAPLLEGVDFRVGKYELRFHAGDYLREASATMPEPLFLDVIPIRFGISDMEAHYHVPLLLSPFGYSTYRGS